MKEGVLVVNPTTIIDHSYVPPLKGYVCLFSDIFVPRK